MKPIIPNFSNQETLSDEVFWRMCEVGLSMPLNLNEADLKKPFLYYRPYGVFYVSPAHHPFAMAQLLSWNNGAMDYMDLETEKFGISDFRSQDIHSFSDYFLKNTVGVCYRSSVSKHIFAGKSGFLNEKELDYFYPIKYLYS